VRTLLIEDNPGDVQLIREMLKEEEPARFTVIVAERLAAGLEILSTQEDIDVVLLDLNLPDSRGLETLVRLQGGFPQLPVLIMTSIADQSLAVQAIRLGAQDYLVKGQLDGSLLRHALAYAGERKKVGQLIRAQAGLLDISHDAIFTWEIGGGILYWNRGAQELYGFGIAEVLGKDPHELVRTGPTAAGELLEKLQRDWQWEGELTHTTRDGRRITVDSRMVVMQGQGGKRLVLETNRDITERKKAELLKDEFIGMVSHELKTPLTILIGALSTAQAPGITPEQVRQLMQDAVDSADSLNGIVDNLLELSRHQARRLDLQRQSSDLGQVAR
jgi:two-component system cell cycle sensor histidine kinase/response regulator CckA